MADLVVQEILRSAGRKLKHRLKCNGCFGGTGSFTLCRAQWDGTVALRAGFESRHTPSFVDHGILWMEVHVLPVAVILQSPE